MSVIAIVSKPLKTELNRLLPELVDWLREHHYEPVVDRETASYLVGPAAAAKGHSGSLIGGIEVRDRPDLPAANPALVKSQARYTTHPKPSSARYTSSQRTWPPTSASRPPATPMVSIPSPK